MRAGMALNATIVLQILVFGNKGAVKPAASGAQLRKKAA
jgi:hypothetical protein